MGTIDDIDYLEIVNIARTSLLEKFTPLMFVIPVQPVANLFRRVAVWLRASPLSEEYIADSLPREFFDAFEL